MALTLFQLLRGFHRRLLWAFALQRLGRGLLLMVIALILAGLLRGWLDYRILPVIAGGAVLLYWALQLPKVPRLFSAAIAIDEQRQTRELYSTALAISRAAAQPNAFERAILQRADDLAGREDVANLTAGSHGLFVWITVLLLAGALPLLWEKSSPNRAEENLALSSEVAGERARSSVSPGNHSARPAESGKLPVSSDGGGRMASLAASDQQNGSHASNAQNRSGSEFAGATAGGGMAAGKMQGADNLPEAPLLNPEWTQSSAAGRDLSSGSGRGQEGSSGTSAGAAGIAGRNPQEQTPAVTGSASPGSGETPVSGAEAAPYREVIKAYFAR